MNVQQHPKQHFNYCVKFSDRTVKVGITSTPFYRLQDFIQEARRHGKTVTGFSLTPPAKSKAIALRVEKALCDLFEQYAIEGHREWFRDDLSWCRESRRAKCADDLARDVFGSLRYEWDKENSTHALVESIRARGGDTPWRDSYASVIELAETLGRSGSRISAAKATAMASRVFAS